MSAPPRAQTLNSGIRLCGSSASLVNRLAPTQWNGTNTVSGRIVVVTRAGALSSPRRVVTTTGSPSWAPIRSASSGCSSTNGPSSGSSRTRRVWAPDWYCASTRPVVRWTRVVGVHGGSAGPRCSTATQPGPAVGVREAVGEQPRRARVVRRRGTARRRRARPGSGRSRCRRSRRGPPAEARPSSAKTVLRVGREARPGSRGARRARRAPRGRCGRPRGGVDRPLAQDHPALEVGHRAGLLGPLGHRQHDVGERGGLRHHEVGDHEQVEGGEPVGDVGGVRRRDHDVAAEHQQGARPAVGAERVEQLVRRAAPARAGCRASTPHTAATCSRAAGSSIIR